MTRTADFNMATINPPPFPAHARAVVRTVRTAFSELLLAVGANPRDGQSIRKECGLNKNLAWKISKIIQEDDPSVALEHMPGGQGITIFLQAAERAGAGPLLLQAARDAVDGYDDLIRTHSGDRATLEVMGTELSPVARQQKDEYYRKLLFQAESYVWGAQARVLVKIAVVGPGRTPQLLDCAALSGLIDFRRLRSDVSWVVAARRAMVDDGYTPATTHSVPMDPLCEAADQAPLMTEFCSKPLPTLKPVANPTGTSFELVGGPIGNTGTLNCVVGTVYRNVSRRWQPGEEWGEHVAICDTPAELLIADVFFHESLTFAIPPQTALYSELGAIVPYPGRGRDHNRLPLSEPLQDLGVAALPPPTHEVQRYNEMIEAMFSRMNWQLSEFHGYRMKFAYPVCPTALVFRYKLPGEPET